MCWSPTLNPVILALYLIVNGWEVDNKGLFVKKRRENKSNCLNKHRGPWRVVEWISEIFLYPIPEWEKHPHRSKYLRRLWKNPEFLVWVRFWHASTGKKRPHHQRKTTSLLREEWKKHFKPAGLNETQKSELVKKRLKMDSISGGILPDIAQVS